MVCLLARLYRAAVSLFLSSFSSPSVIPVRLFLRELSCRIAASLVEFDFCLLGARSSVDSCTPTNITTNVTSSQLTNARLYHVIARCSFAVDSGHNNSRSDRNHWYRHASTLCHVAKCMDMHLSMCENMCIGMCTDMPVHMCKDIRINICMTCLGMYIHMCIDMCMGICIDMCIDMCMDICIDMCTLWTYV